jgi:flagellar motor protein MotB
MSSGAKGSESPDSKSQASPTSARSPTNNKQQEPKQKESKDQKPKQQKTEKQQQQQQQKQQQTKQDREKADKQEREKQEKEKQQEKEWQERENKQHQEKPKSPRRSQNKIYRTPPTPAPEILHTFERSFTLDCIAVHSTSNDYSKARPKLGQVIPPYNAQKDKSVEPYFGFTGVTQTLKRTRQTPPGTSIEGPTIDRFYETGAGYQYLSLRNQHGAGHSRDTIDGHGQFMTGVQPVVGYNGRFGYRRTNPWLRQVPSPFGVATNSPIH